MRGILPRRRASGNPNGGENMSIEATVGWLLTTVFFARVLQLEIRDSRRRRELARAELRARGFSSVMDGWRR
jgi:hypothetical protein